MHKKNQFFINSLKGKGYTLALAESVTCGLAASRLASCSGTSEVLKGSIVCYAPEVKCQLLKVPKKLIKKYTPESKEVTRSLAKKLSRLIKADICAAITGLASPGGSENKKKPVGTVFISMRFNNKNYHLRKLLRGTPLEVREKACDALYDFILKKVKD